MVLTGTVREADLDSVRGKADDVEEETGMCTPRNRRARGPGTQGRIHRDNVGKIGAADKAGNLVGCESPCHQLPEFGWLAMSDACGGNEACSARM
jgi:hypothetical protein